MSTLRARIAAIHRHHAELLFPDADPHHSRPLARLATHRRPTADPRDRPCVGDFVDVRAAPDGSWMIEAILPRTSMLTRRAAGADGVPQPLAANVDLALCFAALPHDVNVRRLARFAALAWDGGASPVVVLSRADLATPDEVTHARRAVALHCPGVPVIAISTRTPDGLAELQPWLTPGITLVLLGASGAGKSSLVNALAGDTRARTGATNELGEGRHTTTGRSLHELAGGVMLLDTPGLREVGLFSDPTASDDGVSRLFADLLTVAASCRFADCRHASEPGCAVRQAVADGALAAERLAQWRELRAEVDHAARTQQERKQDERTGSRLIRQFNRDHRKR